MTQCEVCRVESNKLYWWSGYPTIYLCKNCWGEIEDVRDHLIRVTIARELKGMRAEGQYGRRSAIRFLGSLRGTGVPTRRTRNKIDEEEVL